MRTQIIDELVLNFISQHPNAIILNLGAGMCTRFFRVDNRKIQWYDLDLPEVTQFKSQFLSENHRYHFLPKSVFDLSWFDDVPEIKKTCPNQISILIIAEGLFYYFKKDQVKSVFDTFLSRFPSADIILEVAHP